MKLATWNLMLPVLERRREALRAHTDAIAADVWVLTETHHSFSTGRRFRHSSAGGRDGLHKPEHRWVSIETDYSLEPLETTDRERTAAARVAPPDAAPFLVFGSVLPWAQDSWRGHSATAGVAFHEAVQLQLGDWLRLRHAFPQDEFYLLGDLNQDLVTPRYYGSRAKRVVLEEALKAAGLVAVTAGAGDPVRRDSAPCASVDHICTRTDSRMKAEPPVRWPDRATPDKRLTDHFGIAVTFAPR